MPGNLTSTKAAPYKLVSLQKRGGTGAVAVVAQLLNRVQLFVTPGDAARQAFLSFIPESTTNSVDVSLGEVQGFWELL